MQNHYCNNLNYIPDIGQIISSLLQNNVDMILIGSEAGSIYSLCESKKDIDFLINPDEKNLFAIFQYLKLFFDITSFEDFKKINPIILKSKENKHIELIKYAELISHIEPDSYLSYCKIKDETKKVKFYGSTVDIISLKDYISYVYRGVDKFNKISNPSDREKYHLKKFQNVIVKFQSLKNKNI